MAKISLLHAVCTVAMLAAVPALAQPQRPGGDLVSPNGTPNPDAKQPTSGPLAPANNGANTTSMAPSASNTTPAPAPSDTHPTHHQAMGEKPTHAVSTHMMGRKTDASQDAAVDRLNEESYHAAEKGQMFSAAGSSGGMSSSGTSSTSPAASGAMTNPTK